MTTSEVFADRLTAWYQERARGLLAKAMPDRIEQLDPEFARMDAIRSAAEQDVPVCFLGNSGVGKSTLLNALVAGHIPVLPAGGIGPLTAQATLVRYAPEPYFRVTYLPPKRLHNVLFALERYHELELKRKGAPPVGQSEEVRSEISDDEILEVENMLPVDGEGSDAVGRPEKIEAYRKQAALLILENQFAETETTYLLDSLRECLGQERRWGTQLQSQDRDRVLRIRQALAAGKNGHATFEKTAGGDLPGFLGDLGTHASGFLAPLIRTLEVGWDAEFLRGGTVLVDLPGLGIANDDYRNVTAGWIRKARAVALVVDKSGVTEASAELLRTTGFLNSLLHDSHDAEAEPITLMVVVVKLDLVAEEEKRRELAMQASARKFIAHFDQACERCSTLIQGQLQQEFGRMSDAGSETTRAERDQAIAKMIASLQVHPVAATEYRKALVNDEDDPPRIKSPIGSRVPGLATALKQLSDQRIQRARAAIDARAHTAYERGRGSIELIIKEWQTEVRAHDEAEQLRKELQEYVAPLKNEFLVRQGAFREFLRQSIPDLIDAKVDVASGSAKTDIEGILRKKYGKYHWATLRAAVQRGGTFDGARHVDLPNELTLAFEEPLAVVWAKEILATLRKRTSELGGNYVDMVGQVAMWARMQGARVKPELVEALHNDLKAETRSLGGVGREAIEELKENVKTELFSKVIEQVRKRCQLFVSENRHVGPGVKQRILEFMRAELAEAVVSAARPAAKKVLQKNYSAVNEDISKALGKYRNPLDSSIEAIVGSEEQRLRRSDAQRRRAILAEATTVLEALPQPTGRSEQP